VAAARAYRSGMPPTESGIRPPQQRRSRESLERVLKAGERVLEQKGYEGFTIAEVSRRAKVSVGSVYGRFENKDALIRAIHVRMMERLTGPEEEVAAAPDEAGLDLATAVARGVHALADSMDRERRLLRVFMVRGAVDPSIARPGSQSSQATGRAFKTAVLARREEIGHPDPELAADIAFRMVYDVLARQVMHGPTFESDRMVEWDDLVDELIAAVIAYLRHGGG
jgi:AcrR family transcriptional regulator